MYSPGRILYFDPFYFKNGNSAKPKYFVILHNDSSSTIIASLPTRTENVPMSVPIKHGCISVDEINFNCYHFEANKIITTNNWGFELPTFIYGNQIDTYELPILKDVYRVEGIEYEIIGMLKKEEYKNIIECFLKSKVVKIKYKDVFKKIIEDMGEGSPLIQRE